jgi:hypothetical protein
MAVEFGAGWCRQADDNRALVVLPHHFFRGVARQLRLGEGDHFLDRRAGLGSRSALGWCVGSGFRADGGR